MLKPFTNKYKSWRPVGGSDYCPFESGYEIDNYIGAIPSGSFHHLFVNDNFGRSYCQTCLRPITEDNRCEYIYCAYCCEPEEEED